MEDDFASSLQAEVSRLRRDLDAVTKENKSLLSERCSIQAKASDFTEVSREKDEIQTRASKLDEDLKQVQSDKYKVEVLLAEEKKSLEEKDSVNLTYNYMLFISCCYYTVCFKSRITHLQCLGWFWMHKAFHSISAFFVTF